MSTPAVLLPCNLPPRGPLLPPELRAGDTLTLLLQTTLTPGWLVFFVLTAIVNQTPVRILLGVDTDRNPNLSVDANGLATLALVASVTAAWTPGRYDWVAFSVDPTGARTQIAQGATVVLPDVAGATIVDPRTEAQINLDAIRAVLKENLGASTFSYKIGTREFVNVTRESLMKSEAIYEARVRREQGRPRRPGPAVTFGRSR